MKSDPKINSQNNHQLDLIERDHQIVAAVDKDAFRAMFYLFAGKPDSKHQSFPGKVTLSPSDLIDVNERVHDKFKLHNITQVITTVSLSLDHNQTLDFGTWAEFISHDWRDPAAVRDLTIRWDFLIKLDSYAQPQRHTLTVNFSAGMNPTSMLRIVVDAVDAPQDIDMSKMFGGCIAKVDFISHSLADELLALIGRWHSILPVNVASGTLLEKCEKNDELIAKIIHHSMPLTAAVVSYFLLQNFVGTLQPDSPLTVTIMKFFSLWTLGALMLIWGASGLGKFIASCTYRAITKYGAHHTFRFTNGDTVRAKALEVRNKKSATRFCCSIAQAVSLHVIAGIIVIYLMGKH